jgi:hypothetical protein
MNTYKFNELADAPLIIDAIYEGGASTKMNDEPISALLPKSSNRGGFRVVKRTDEKSLPAYIVLFSTFSETEWPDSLDVENGVLKYYGDNRNPGTELHNTHKLGNVYLKKVFDYLNSPTMRRNIPPFLVFKYAGKALDVQFLGIAVPGNPNIPSDRELTALWKTKNGQRFQNYEAYFSILDTQNESISKEWLTSLICDHNNALGMAPSAWKTFIEKGRSGIKPLTAPKLSVIPDMKAQLPDNAICRELVQTIRDHYKGNPFGFENAATKLIQMMDANFFSFDLTRPWRDGGRDAIGKYRIGNNIEPLYIDCALEAKCYAENNSVGVKQTSRLISRIRYRQFGVLVTTSYLGSQAYKEIVEDGNPILVINAKDIADILRNHDLGDLISLHKWLDEIDMVY